MREHTSSPGRSRIVTSSALCRSRNMRCRFHLRIRGNIRAVVAGCAVGPGAVIHGRR